MKIAALISARRAATLVAVAVAALAPASAYAAPKRPAPKLTIETAECQTGLALEQRSLTVTAFAVPRSASDGVAMRFRAQQRGPDDTKWRKAVTIGGQIGVWEKGSPGAALRLNKFLRLHAEETRYRVIIETRAVDAKGKTASRTTKRTVKCDQPRQTADVRIRRLTYAGGGGGSAEPFLNVVLRNAGEQTAAPTQLTLLAPDGSTVRTERVAALKGHATRVVRIPVATCEPGQRVIVEPADRADGRPESDDHRADVRCPGRAPASKTRR